AVVLRYDLWAWLKQPIDGGATFRGRRLFGDNKTWRGVACTVVGCMIALTIQKYMVREKAGAISVIDYNRANVFWLGTALACGAAFGELPNSFVKRQLGIDPGMKGRGVFGPLYYVWDQVDILLTSWPLLLFWVRPSGRLVLMSFVLVFLVHQLLSLVGYWIG